MNKKNIILISKEQTKDYVVFHNQTSKQDCFDYDRMQFTSLDDWGFSLLCTKGKCAVGHALDFFVFDSDSSLKKMGKMPKNHDLMKADLDFLAKVVAVEPIDDEMVEISFELLDCKKEKWDAFLKKYNWKQDKINYVFDKFRI